MRERDYAPNVTFAVCKVIAKEQGALVAFGNQAAGLAPLRAHPIGRFAALAHLSIQAGKID